MVGPELRSVSFWCRGHPDIRGSHHKSLEFTRQATISARATCVLGVSADAGLGELTGFRGPVAITVEAGTSRDVVHAVANPAFEPGESAVIRTSRHASRETLAVAADKGADGLDPDLIIELADAATTVRVTVAEQPAPGRPGVGEVTFVALPELRSAHITPEIREALTGADAVLAADPPAVRAALESEGIEVPVSGEEACDGIRARLRAGERLAYLAVTGACAPVDEKGSDTGLARAAAAAAGAESATRILPAPPLELAAQVAAAPEAAPYTLVAPPALERRGRVAALEAAAAAGADLVWRTAPPSVSDALTEVDDVAGGVPVRLCVNVASRQGFVLRGSAPDVARQWDELGRPPGDTLVVVAGHGPRQGDTGRLDATLSALLDENVSTRTLARALGSLPGHDYRSEYRRILRLKSSRRPGAG